MRTFLKLLAAGSASLLVAVLLLPGMNSVPMASAAQADYYLKIEGIDGEIEVMSWSWGAGIIAPRDIATGQSSGKRQYQPIIIRKRIDKTTPLLAKAVMDGKSYKKATLMRRTSDGTQQAYTVGFQDVVVAGFQHEADAGSAPMETIAIAFQKIEMK